MSDDSDVEMRSALPKKTAKKPPPSPTTELLDKPGGTKKLTTKDMIHEALTDLKSRKGASLYAIKKHMQEKHNVDTEKNNYIIKKSLKLSVEMGTIVQTKGIGASGSFKLAPTKKAEGKKKMSKIEKPKKADKSDKPKKVTDKQTDKEEAGKEKAPKKVTIAKTSKTMEKPAKTAKKGKHVEGESKIKKIMKTPKKRAAMMKRKSIGSIIKPPKMKPKAKA